MTTHPTPDGPPHRLESARALARLLDRSFRIPGTRVRFGLDPILGLLPVGGDVLAALGSGYILFVAWRNGAPGRVLGRMLLNVVVDTLAGSVPVVGDIFDAGWKANSRNVGLLESWLGSPAPPARRSPLALAGIVAALIALVAGLVAATWWLGGLVFGT